VEMEPVFSMTLNTKSRRIEGHQEQGIKWCNSTFSNVEIISFSYLINF